MSPRAVSRLYEGHFDEASARDLARELRQQLGCEPTLGIIFATADYLPKSGDFLETIRLHAHIPVLVGSSGEGILGSGREMEGKPGFSLLLLHLPGATVTATPISPARVEEAAVGGPKVWQKATGFGPEKKPKAWFLLADPFSFPVERWMQQWNEAWPGVPAFGALASGLPSAGEASVFLNGEIVESAVAVAFEGDIEIHTLVSQGCRPIGEPYTITSVDQNVLYTLGSQPAYKILDGAFQGLTDNEKERAKNNLFAGLAMSEYIEEFKPGDFLVRSILGADPNTGAVAIAARPRVGQTLQYQFRDAEVASTDLHHRLLLKQTELARLGKPPVAALVCTCNGRGLKLFGPVSHDAQAVDQLFPGLPATGFFANGEIGPAGSQSHIHGYSASIALFCRASA